MISRIMFFLLLCFLLVNCSEKPAGNGGDFIPPERNKVLFIGIDGASWNVIDPLIEDGKLPNLEKFMKSATYGDIVMTEGELFSPIIWTSMFTGVHPERHGLIEKKSSLSIFRRQKALWNYLSESDRLSTVINVPGTFPPENLLGYEISGFPMEHSLIGDNMGTFCDLEFESGSKDFVNSGLEIKNTSSDSIFIVDIGFEGKTEDNKYHFVLSYKGENQIATLSLSGWSAWLTFEMNPNFTIKTRLYLLDIKDGKYCKLYFSPMARMPNDAWTYFSPPGLYNEVLEIVDEYVPHEIGWWKLIYKPITLGLLYDYVVEAERIRAEVGLELYQRKEWPLFIQVFTMLDRIQHPFWPYKEPEEYGKVEPDLVKRYGDRVERSYMEIDGLIGKYLDLADENTIVVIASDHGFQARRLREVLWTIPKKALLEWMLGKEPQKRVVTGVHRKAGVYMISGKPVGSGVKGDRIAIVDIAPTILYLLGENIPKDLDGEVLGDLIQDEYFSKFSPVFVDGQYGVRKTNPREIDPSALEQIKSMGYIE